jgi:hypothetical protein
VPPPTRRPLSTTDTAASAVGLNSYEVLWTAPTYRPCFWFLLSIQLHQGCVDGRRGHQREGVEVSREAAADPSGMTRRRRRIAMLAKTTGAATVGLLWESSVCTLYQSPIKPGCLRRLIRSTVAIIIGGKRTLGTFLKHDNKPFVFLLIADGSISLPFVRKKELG